MQTFKNYSYPLLQFREKSIIGYSEYLYTGNKWQSEIKASLMRDVRKEHKAYSGEITVGARKRLTKAISLLVQSSRKQQLLNPVTNKWQSFKLSFITLTIPECNTKPDAKFCNKNLLEPMLRTLRRKYGLKNYVWKLELQKNGMVHYHLSSGLFINHVHLRNEWNRILERNGMLKDFENRHGHLNPNSTDVHSIRKVKNLEAYLIKYVSKSDEFGRTINAKVWDCNKALKGQKYYVVHEKLDYQERLEQLIKNKSITYYSGERFIIYKFNERPAEVLLDRKDLKNYYEHLTKIRNEHETINQKAESSLRTASNDYNKKHEKEGREYRQLQFKIPRSSSAQTYCSPNC